MRRVTSAPTASMTRSAPRPSVGSSSASRASSPDSCTAPAPRASACSRRACTGSTACTWGMLSRTAACRHIRPMVPAPITTVCSTGPSASPSLAAWTPLARGSARAPVRASTPSGSGYTFVAGASAYSAKPPGEWMPTSLRFGHRLVDPFTDLRDGAGELVAHHEGRGTVAHPAQVAFDLRAADPRCGGADDDGPGLDGRLGHLLEGHLLRTVPHDTLHTSTFPLRAFQIIYLTPGPAALRSGPHERDGPNGRSRSAFDL